MLLLKYKTEIFNPLNSYLFEKGTALQLKVKITDNKILLVILLNLVSGQQCLPWLATHTNPWSTFLPEKLTVSQLVSQILW
jgi:hypothetical protein